MADVRRRRFDCVLVWKYDCFGNYVLDLSQPPAPLPFGLPIPTQSQAQAAAPV
jgi:hypothetical protein